MLPQLQKELHALKNPAKAQNLQRFFKTKPGEYGEGDIFIGITVPQIREVAKKFSHLSFQDIQILLQSKIHEERMIALIILVSQFQKSERKNADPKLTIPSQKTIYNFYLKNTHGINNWDLVDISAGYIVGGFLKDKEKSVLTKLAHSKNIWERRIAILATFYDIKEGRPAEALRIATILLHDKHDLIQKAVGWMLREIGKRCSIKEEENFLQKHYQTMPRTMLRYAIEKFPEKKRQQYLKK